MTIDTSREAVERLLDCLTPGPWQSDGVFMDRDHEVRVAMPDVCGVPMATIAEAFHNWNDVTDVAERRISWKEAEANARFIAAARDLVPALLAERDAALAEVARLSTPPDDAEVAALVKRLSGTPLYEGHGEASDAPDEAADAITRLFHALAAETARREAMEAALAGLIEHAHNCERELTEDLHHVDFCGESLPLTAARATLAKHGSK